MTASLSILHRGYVPEMDDGERVEPVGKFQNGPWNPQQFGEEQIRGLVRRVFSPGWPRPSSQVVFSAADDGIDIASLCRRTGGMLAREGVGRVCLIEANLRSRALELSLGVPRVEATARKPRIWFESPPAGSGTMSGSCPARCFWAPRKT